MTFSDSDLQPYVAALTSDDPFGRLIRLVIEFKKQGGTQLEAEKIVFQAAVRCGAWNTHDSRDAAAEDVICCIAGQCCASNHLFANDFDERHFFRELPPLAEQDTGDNSR